MSDLTTSIVESLDGQDKNIFPFLPYLLQDLWEIGASPPHLIKLIKRNNLNSRIKKVIDLGCGKGAVSIQMAKEFGWHIDGIDAMPEFIEEAQAWSQQYGTKDLCNFEVGDIRIKIESLKEYDLAILGSIGPILGPIEDTLNSLKPCLNKPGYILFDDGYLKKNNYSSPHDYPTQDEALRQIHFAGYEILDETIYPSDFLSTSNQNIFKAIKKRAHELQKQYPLHKQAFKDYVDAQEIENNALENKIVCVTWLLKTNG